MTRMAPVFEDLSKRFRRVIFISGNHELYNSSWWDAEADFWKGKELPSNVTVLNQDAVNINSVVFIGATLWTDFGNNNPFSLLAAKRSMNDFRLIKSHSGEILCPEDTVVRHELDRDFIFQKLLQKKHEGFKTVVLTHHLPSYQSVNKRYAGDVLNAAFASELGGLIQDGGPDIWIHGHTHDSIDYCLGNTRIVCNPYGYFNSEVNPKYDRTKLIEL